MDNRHFNSPSNNNYRPGGGYKPKRPFPRKEELHKINNRITAFVVRVVGDGVEPQICSLKEALQMADSMNLDLVEISPDSTPPVCKILDYKKFLYEQKRKQKEIKAHSAKVVVKEIRMGPNTDEHDFQFKLKHAINFLKEGFKVKVEVFFKGRTIIYKDQGEIKLLQFAQDLVDYGKVENLPKLEGKRMIMLISPKKK